MEPCIDLNRLDEILQHTRDAEDLVDTKHAPDYWKVMMSNTHDLITQCKFLGEKCTHLVSNGIRLCNS